jgi:hypothetical protein
VCTRQDLHAFGFRNDLSRAPQKNKKRLPAAATNVDGSSSEDDAVDESRDFISRESSSESAAEFGPLELRDLCRMCLHKIAFYEPGLVYSPAAAKAIAQRVCIHDEIASGTLIQQALSKLYMVASDYTWNHMVISSINDFLRMLMAIPDGLQSQRFLTILASPQCGLAYVIAMEKYVSISCAHLLLLLLLDHLFTAVCDVVV